MGQVYLGFRSLLVKIVVFVVMAALLAWAIGGTLWPRTAMRIVGTPIMIDGVKVVLVDQIGDGTGTFGLATVGDENQILQRWPRAELTTPVWKDALSPVDARWHGWSRGSPSRQPMAGLDLRGWIRASQGCGRVVI